MPEEAQTKLKTPFRDLKPGEPEALFKLYDKYNGNCSKIVKDVDCQFKSRKQVAYYRDRYDFIPKFSRIVSQRAQAYKNKIIGSLEKKKLRALERVFELLENQQIEAVDKEGNLISIPKKPTYKELEAAMRIIKTELGEPSMIHKSENVIIDEDTQELHDEIKELIKSNKKDFQGGRQPVNNPPSV